MLKRLRFLQVGDVHFPSTSTAPRSIDDKDSKFPAELKGSVSTLPLKAVIKRIHTELTNNNVDALFFMGDLTDRGDLGGFNNCAGYLMDALELAPGRQFQNIPVGFVPGNHDVDRRLAVSKGIKGKFETLAAVMAKVGAKHFPTENAITFSVGTAPAQATVYLLNSCWGCGEPEHIPLEFRDAIRDALDKVLSGNPDAASTYYDRQLDTPAFDADTISFVSAAISEGPSTSLPIVIAHHNLLPQRLTRLAPYTELVNSGALRAALAEAGRPCIYLHGHIHEDPVEIVTTGAAWPLVIVSAPEACVGYNVIEVVFTQSGLPLACHIIPYRYEAGVVRRTSEISLPLLGSRRRSSDKLPSKIYSWLLDNVESYWPAVLAHAISVNPHVTVESVIETLELLSADGSASIENRDLAHEYWIIRAAV